MNAKAETRAKQQTFRELSDNDKAAMIPQSRKKLERKAEAPGGCLLIGKEEEAAAEKRRNQEAYRQALLQSSMMEPIQQSRRPFNRKLDDYPSEIGFTIGSENIPANRMHVQIQYKTQLDRDRRLRDEIRGAETERDRSEEQNSFFIGSEFRTKGKEGSPRRDPALYAASLGSPSRKHIARPDLDQPLDAYVNYSGCTGLTIGADHEVDFSERAAQQKRYSEQLSYDISARERANEWSSSSKVISRSKKDMM